MDSTCTSFHLHLYPLVVIAATVQKVNLRTQLSSGNNKLSNLLCDDIDNAYYFVGSRATRNERKYYFNLKVKVNCFLRKVCVQLFKIKASFWLAC